MIPADGLDLLARYGALILPILVVAEQVGVPLPAVPALLGVGALAANGRGSIPLVLGAITVVALVVDLTWYEVGRRRGAPVLARLCRLALEPDSCVRRTQDVFVRYGVRGMLVAKFLPGLTTVMPPLAGVFAVGRLRFVVYEILGVLLWAGLWIGVGFVFSDAIATVAAGLARLERVLVVVVAVVVGYIAVKYVRRRLFLRGAETPARRRGARHARRSADATRGRGDAGRGSREPLAVDRRARPAPLGSAARARAGPLLLLTERGHERPGGARAPTQGHHARAPARGGTRRLAGARLSGRGPGAPAGADQRGSGADVSAPARRETRSRSRRCSRSAPGARR
jgi:membrane protein DedA with SNARE-associated domain